jgi:hypothetical protein
VQRLQQLLAIFGFAENQRRQTFEQGLMFVGR